MLMVRQTTVRQDEVMGDQLAVTIKRVFLTLTASDRRARASM
jgi:hypothetical protein